MIRLFSRPAHGHAIHLDGWNADADGHALPIFAAGAYTFIELKVVSDHGDAGEGVGTVSDESGVLYWRGDHAILYQVGLGGREHELAVGDINLAAAEVCGVQTTLYGADNVFRRILARQHVSIGHARHGNVLIAFATAVAGVGNAHQARR